MRVKRGLAGLASVGAVLLIGALTPSAATAHPCIAEAEAGIGSNLTLHTGGNWAGAMPSIGDLNHECADDLTSDIYRSVSETSAEAEPIGDAISTFSISRLTALGYSARNVPMIPGSPGSGVYNSDLAFKDNLVIQGTYEGFRIVDFTDKKAPTQLVNVTGCTVPQGDVVVYGNILVRSWDSPANASSMCGGELVGAGFEGIHIFDISNPAQPQFIRGMRFSQQGMPAGALLGCGSHTATAVPDPTRDALYIYNGGSSGACRGIDIFKIKISDPSDATVIRRAEHGTTNSCHDNNVLMNVGGGNVSYAMCAGGNGLAMFAFDMTKPAGEAGTPASPGGVENPTLLWAKAIPGVDIGHSGSFTYDGKLLFFGWEPQGGTQARCQATSTVVERTLFFLDPLTGDTKGTMLHPRPQTSRENCTWHNFNVVPTEAGYFATVGSYQSGISVFEFTNPAAPRELAFADPAPLQIEPPVSGIISGGDWSTYWHNGYIYESDMKRGVISWELNLPSTGNAAPAVAEAREQLRHFRTFATSNPQTQTVSYAPNPGATITVRSPVEGAALKMGTEVIADFDCSDDTAVVTCVGTVADGAAVNTSTLGNKVFRVTATDSNGTVTTKDVPYMVNSRDYTLSVGSNSPDTTLELLMPAASPSLGAFTPGFAREYLASAAPRITSTAGDAALSVTDPATSNVGRLVNGSATLVNALQVYASSTNAAAVAAPGGSLTAATLPLMSWSAPVTNSTTTLTFRQNITATETLRTGAYAKTLTFTLSTTAP
jgi:hypothetical protein